MRGGGGVGGRGGGGGLEAGWRMESDGSTEILHGACCLPLACHQWRSWSCSALAGQCRSWSVP